jgi:hypothetical protein
MMSYLNKILDTEIQWLYNFTGIERSKDSFQCDRKEHVQNGVTGPSRVWSGVNAELNDNS